MEISILPAKKEDLSAIIEIANTQLGKDYLTKTLPEAIDNTNSLLQAAKLSNSKIVGFGLFQVIKNETIIKSIAINPDFRNKGIATKLVKQGMTFAETNNCKLIKGYAWESKTGILMEGIFTKLDFQKTKKLTNYWKEDSIEKGYNCPTCGEPPCMCSAIVFEKELATPSS